MLQDAQDVEVFEAAFDHLWVAHCLLEDEAQAIYHIPDQLRRFKDVEERDKLAADQLEELGVVNLRIDVLAMSDLFLFTFCESVIVATEFKDVLGKLARYRRCRTLRILIGLIDPKVNLFEHFVDAKGVLEDKHLLQSRHLQSCDATLIGYLLLLSCSLGLWLAQRVQRLQSTIE